MWSFPGAVLWLPTAINAWIAAQILLLSWQRARGGYNTAQGEIGPYMYTIAISAPIAVAILVGWVVLALLRANVPHTRESEPLRGVIALAVINIAAPALLFLALKWLT